MEKPRQAATTVEKPELGKITTIAKKAEPVMITTTANQAATLEGAVMDAIAGTAKIMDMTAYMA